MEAIQNPVPAILEYTPYHKRDVTRMWDGRTHPWFAERGYGCSRVDIDRVQALLFDLVNEQVRLDQALAKLCREDPGGAQFRLARVEETPVDKLNRLLASAQLKIATYKDYEGAVRQQVRKNQVLCDKLRRFLGDLPYALEH